MVPLLLQVWSQPADVVASVLIRLACNQSRCWAAAPGRIRSWAPGLLQKAGMLALSASCQSLHGLDLGGCVVEAPLLLWQLGCQMSHASPWQHHWDVTPPGEAGGIQHASVAAIDDDQFVRKAVSSMVHACELWGTSSVQSPLSEKRSSIAQCNCEPQLQPQVLKPLEPSLERRSIDSLRLAKLKMRPHGHH